MEKYNIKEGRELGQKLKSLENLSLKVINAFIIHKPKVLFIKTAPKRTLERNYCNQ